MLSRTVFRARALSTTAAVATPRVTLEGYTTKTISLRINQLPARLSHLFLRDACDSPLSQDPYSRQKLFNTGSLDPQVRPARPPQCTERGLEVTWSDGVSSVYLPAFLERYASGRSDTDLGADKVFWDLKTLEKDQALVVEHITYDQYMSDNAALYTVVNNLNKYGLAFVNDIPSGKDFRMKDGKWAIEHVAERIGYIHETFYGRLFDVKSVKKATNIAYTSVYLPLHMDLCYYEAPPGLQILHALQNTTEGGENIFADAYRAAMHVRDVDSVAYAALKEVPINYHYNHPDNHYFYSRPLITEDANGRIKEVAYSPPFQAPFEHAIDGSVLFENFMRGMKLFESFIEDPKNQLVIKTKEGTAVLFDNRRTLHARKAFKEEGRGERWLKGCYLARDAFESKVRVLKRTYG